MCGKYEKSPKKIVRHDSPRINAHPISEFKSASQFPTFCFAFFPPIFYSLFWKIRSTHPAPRFSSLFPDIPLSFFLRRVNFSLEKKMMRFRISVFALGLLFFAAIGPAHSGVSGDINLDGVVGLKEAVFALQVTAGL